MDVLQFVRQFAWIREVMAAFDEFLCNLLENDSRNYTRATCNKENIPVSSYSFSSDKLLSLQFWTIRNHEYVRIVIAVRKLEPRFYDDEESDEVCLEISVDRELANPKKFQQDFSIFLGTEKPNLINFITETIWPHIDATVRKDEKKAQKEVERVNRLNRGTIPREDHPRYSLRARKNIGNTR